MYQDLALCDNLDVVANMFLGRETVDGPAALGRLAELDMERRALDVLRRLNVTTIRSVRSPVATLSGGQRQSVAISRAVMWNSKIVLLDEPTAALGVAQTHQVRELIKRLRMQGLGVVLISHNLHDVFEVADRIIVLRLGRTCRDIQARRGDARGCRGVDNRRARGHLMEPSPDASARERAAKELGRRGGLGAALVDARARPAAARRLGRIGRAAGRARACADLDLFRAAGRRIS